MHVDVIIDADQVNDAGWRRLQWTVSASWWQRRECGVVDMHLLGWGRTAETHAIKWGPIPVKGRCKRGGWGEAHSCFEFGTKQHLLVGNHFSCDPEVRVCS